MGDAVHPVRALLDPVTPLFVISEKLLVDLGFTNYAPILSTGSEFLKPSRRTACFTSEGKVSLSSKTRLRWVEGFDFDRANTNTFYICTRSFDYAMIPSAFLDYIGVTSHNETDGSSDGSATEVEEQHHYELNTEVRDCYVDQKHWESNWEDMSILVTTVTSEDRRSEFTTSMTIQSGSSSQTDGREGSICTESTTPPCQSPSGERPLSSGSSVSDFPEAAEGHRSTSMVNLGDGSISSKAKDLVQDSDSWVSGDEQQCLEVERLFQGLDIDEGSSIDASSVGGLSTIPPPRPIGFAVLRIEHLSLSQLGYYLEDDGSDCDTPDSSIIYGSGSGSSCPTEETVDAESASPNDAMPANNSQHASEASGGNGAGQSSSSSRPGYPAGDGSSSPEEGDGRRKRRRRSHQSDNPNSQHPSSIPRLACPYQSYERWRGCLSKGPRNPAGGCVGISRLK